MIETSFSGYSGGDFLLFYAALLVAAIVAGLWIPGFLRPEGRGGQLTEATGLAYLAGGSKRLADAVIARLIGSGAMEVSGKSSFAIMQAEAGQNAAERAVLRGGGEVSFKAARETITTYGDNLDADLVAQGLLIEPGERGRLRMMAVLPYLLVIAIGLWRAFAGNAQGEPIGFLIALMVLTAVLALWRYIRFDPRTQAGQALLAERKAVSDRIRNAPTGPELGHSVALFGTAVLVGTPYADLHAMRRSADGAGSIGDSGGDSVDGGGAGGCGGGGCGGCGG
ncbi:TIGR04222 domain-containing membrane protein [Qipengyuania marisflavi]|uniref:TIGR04222 domain-containing membrane protein n=1 Tax=Qipengyuania marisflavi TaxID=2486356 RepID=A0A5S3P9I4_9SPHN|nr:TIGR04222 domain-containing membrane protein [Qipengyuania marisflavi]TMM50121.1 TIGR04222 domain-containing membrane protein [Qipengyuania marisflavi]